MYIASSMCERRIVSRKPARYLPAFVEPAADEVEEAMASLDLFLSQP
jgi:hypothetical protein